MASKKPIWVAIKNGVKTTFLTELAEKIIEFETIEGLCKELSK